MRSHVLGLQSIAGSLGHLRGEGDKLQPQSQPSVHVLSIQSRSASRAEHSRLDINSRPDQDPLKP